ncbi:MAG: NADH-quinone oxidoreductase subunit M [Anaerolineaceae bacterium]|nr:NADH-quinone oxidoreductase subunit M [Anaerolineaceae bacterium]
MNDHLLTWILFLPAISAVGLLFLPREKTNLLRWAALAASLIPLVLTIVVWVRFNPSLDPKAGFQFEELAPWFPAIGSAFHLGIDGISLTMLLLTTLLTPLGVLTSFNIKENVKAYLALFLLLETGILGVFLSLDLLMFFVFWEIGLIPMYFLINQWGGANRNYASLKFILFTMGGSLGLLLAIQLIGLSAGTFDLPTLLSQFPQMQLSILGLPSETVKAIAFWAFVIAFAIKVPIWPFHTWLPDAHTEAPTGGSMILAGVLLKLGAYGFLRLVLPLYPVESHRYATALAVLAAAAIVFGALAAYGQKDFKRLVAYSSVNHMGFVVLGIAAAAWATGSGDAAAQQSARIATNGAVLQMFNHGLSSAGMFFLVGVLYDQAHTRQLDDFGGIFRLLPVYGTILILVSMASLGLPGLNGFVSELMVVLGTWPIFTLLTAISMIGLIFTGAYVLKAIRQVLHGPLNERWQGHLVEINRRELVVIVPLVILILSLGLWPAWLLNIINPAVMFWF